MKEIQYTRQFYLSDLTKLNCKTDKNEIINILEYLATTQKQPFENFRAMLEKKIKYAKDPHIQAFFIRFLKEEKQSSPS